MTLLAMSVLKVTSVVPIPSATSNVGASLTTTPTAMLITSVSVNAPPVPVLPRSSVETVTVAVPLKDVFGVKVEPSRAVLISSMVPVNVIVVSSVPSPTVNVTFAPSE